MDPDRQNALALLKRHGWNTTSFQLLEPAFSCWFDEGNDGFVGYVDTGRAWVAGGSPVCAPDAIAKVTQGFIAAARQRGRRACFFAVGDRFLAATGAAALLIGEQPTWDPQGWSRTLASSASLRAQLRRPAARGVTVRLVQAQEVAPGQPLREELDRIVAAWSRQKPMAPMGFLVDLEPFTFPDERIYAVALQGSAPVAFLAAVPIYARRAWLFEDLLRLPGAPNGTTEALIDVAIREAAARGATLVTLGLAPLSGEVPRRLAWARELSRPLYDFAGVRAFKARLRPDDWEPVYLALAPGGWQWLALWDALQAFARGSFVSFGLRTVARGPTFVIWGLIAALAGWIPVLALVEPARWFPAPWVQRAWVGFDLALVVLLSSLARRYRAGLARLALGLVAADAAITLAETIFWNLPRLEGPAELAGAVVACTGPLLGALGLRGMIRGREEMRSLTRRPQP